MDLPKVIIKGSYADFLAGKEVEATVVSQKSPVEEGMLVMGFHNSIAVNTGISVPREKQSQYIGIEGRVTEIHHNSATGKHASIVKVVKV